MLKSGDKVLRVDPLCSDKYIKVGSEYVVHWVGKKRVTLVGVPDNVWFLTNAFKKVKSK